jgi:hypothetical protein
MKPHRQLRLEKQISPNLAEITVSTLRQAIPTFPTRGMTQQT